MSGNNPNLDTIVAAALIPIGTTFRLKSREEIYLIEETIPLTLGDKVEVLGYKEGYANIGGKLKSVLIVDNMRIYDNQGRRIEDISRKPQRPTHQAYA